mmetsp:Transcript_3744/g.5241  ORF Transcript_3744/g.5241 Transcript_3744/m.5241 type:complete len:280 (-) Transcript_3744:3038-3877(-)
MDRLKLEDLDSLTCPLSLERFVDPVILVFDGHTYEKKYIEEWLALKSSSPITGEEIPAEASSRLVVPNHTIKKMIQELEEVSPRSHSQEFFNLHKERIHKNHEVHQLPPAPLMPSQRPPPPLPPRQYSKPQTEPTSTLSTRPVAPISAIFDTSAADREYALRLMKEEIEQADALSKQCERDEEAARELAAADAAREQAEKRRIEANDAIKARQLSLESTQQIQSLHSKESRAKDDKQPTRQQQAATIEKKAIIPNTQNKFWGRVKVITTTKSTAPSRQG